MSQTTNSSCPVCSSSHFEIFFELQKMPVFCSLLWSNEQLAQNCAKGDIKLAFCPDCGFIENVAFDAAKLEYTEAYECSLDFSPRFQSYAKSLAEKLITRHNLHQKKIIEIGCGKGDFLFLICNLGDNYGIGFDPTYVYRPEHDQYPVEFVQDYYSESYADYYGDFVLCRHTLEHIQNPTSFLATIRRTIGSHNDVKVFFEVPNALDTFGNLAVWDIIYEHCCYFSPGSLSSAFSLCGFQVTETIEEYRGQFLCLEAVPTQTNQDLDQKLIEPSTRLKNDIVNFPYNFQKKIAFWEQKLQEAADSDQRVVLWGAGSKGVTFLNVIIQQKQIKYVVDINPNKKGKYIPGTGQEIVEPNFLIKYQPDLVIVMNPIYESEIRQMLKDINCFSEVIISNC
ncbi:MAG: methyltransferase domain-containing protein [Cyanobacteria bacterium J06648_1]